MTLFPATKRNNFHAFERTENRRFVRKKKKKRRTQIFHIPRLPNFWIKINTLADSKFSKFIIPRIHYETYYRYYDFFARISILFSPSRRINSEIVSRILGCGYSQLRRDLAGMQNIAYRQMVRIGGEPKVVVDSLRARFRKRWPACRSAAAGSGLKNLVGWRS